MSLFDLILRRLVREEAPQPIRTDGASVIITSKILGCTEFELFRIAHREWFGSPIADSDAEALFKPYVFTGEVPFWVRFFCNHVDNLYARGELDVDKMRGNGAVNPAAQINTLIA